MVKGRVRNTHLRRKGLSAMLTPAGLAIGAAGTAFFGALLWFFVFSSIFLVDKVAISGPTSLTTDQLNSVFYNLQDKRILFFIPGNHLIFLSPKAVQAELKEEFPYISDVSDFNRTWPDKVEFSVLEQNPSFLLVSQHGRRYSLNSAGEVLGEAVGQLPENIVILTGETPSEVAYGQPILTLPILNFARELGNGWPARFGFRPSRYDVVTEQAGGEFAIFMNEGWFIKADSDDNSAQLIQNLGLVIDNEIKTEELRQQLAYIDLRLSSRAFYCLKSQPCATR